MLICSWFLLTLPCFLLIETEAKLIIINKIKLTVEKKVRLKNNEKKKNKEATAKLKQWSSKEENKPEDKIILEG